MSLEICCLKPDQAKRVSEMVINEFPEMHVLINPELPLTRPLPAGELLVAIEIPQGRISMVEFWRRLIDTTI